MRLKCGRLRHLAAGRKFRKHPEVPEPSQGLQTDLHLESPVGAGAQAQFSRGSPTCRYTPTIDPLANTLVRDTIPVSK